VTSASLTNASRYHPAHLRG